MSSISSQHVTGRAAYTQGDHTSSTNRSESAEKTEAEFSAREVTDHADLDVGDGDELSVEEQQMIKENFPDDPELSMRLYGRSRDAQAMNPGAVGSNLDVTG